MATARSTHPNIAIRNILFATDFGKNSQRAQETALAYARHFGASVHVLHAFDSVAVAPAMAMDMPGTAITELETQAHHQLERVVREFTEHGVAAKAIFALGNVESAVERAAEEERIDLIILGTHGIEGLERLVLGSIAEDLIRSIECPVLTVGPQVKTVRPDMAFQRVLFATDFGEASKHAASLAVALACENHGRLLLAHIMSRNEERAPDTTRLNRYVEDQLRRMVPHDALSFCDAEYIVKQGHTAETILDLAREEKADVIVLGTRNSGGFLSHFYAGVAYEVICRAPCPVLTLRE
jgi:nucleotide-binding universal stress UspA family protein